MLVGQIDFVVHTVQAEMNCSCRHHEVDIVKDFALFSCGDVDLGHDVSCYLCRFLARALLDAAANLRKYAFLACSARLARSCGCRTPSGSTSRSNRDKETFRAGAVWAAGSLI